MRKMFIIVTTLLLLTTALIYPFWPGVLWALVVIVPATLVGIYDMLQTRHALWRTFPLIGRGRWV